MLYSAKSDIGRKRTENQDYFGIKEYSSDLFLAVVCDGMGGRKGGYEASHAAVDAFLSYMDTIIQLYITKRGRFDADDYDIKNALCDAADSANMAVISKQKTSEELSGMGTTLVGVLVTADAFYTINIGDSRLYYITKDGAEQISHDHSLVQYLVDMGKLNVDEARNAPNKNIITRAIGSGNEIEADIFKTELTRTGGAYILLCTDGLSNYLTPDNIKDTVTTPVDDLLPLFEDLSLRADKLIDRANELGGADNITAVLISV